MAGVKITIDDAQVKAAFARLRKAAAAPFNGELGEDIGDYMLRATRKRAEREVSPDGLPWVELSARYARRKAKKAPAAGMLVFDDHMLGPNLSYQAGDDFVDIGTSAPYGATHQFGRLADGIPARPWLGLADEDEAEIGRLISDWLDDTAEGR